MAITTKNFGKTQDGKEVTLYTITNGKGFTAEVTDFGAILVNLFVPDKAGTSADVVLGYDSVEGYLANGCFFGATIGPSANRIDQACFTIDGKTYQLAANDGTNNLHSDDNNGYHKRIWNAAPKDNSVVFTLADSDGSMGFPGNKNVQLTYTVTDDNELQIAYEVTSDQNTLINMTNHSYFNLAGHDSGNIEGHRLSIHASHYTPIFERLIPTGELADVTGTPFDFRTMKAVGEDINQDNVQLGYGQGYDHNYALDGFDGTIQKVASVEEPTTGRKMDVYTDQPGLQFYAGNCITPQTGKGGAAYEKRSGLCLETQCFPDAINQPQFQNVIYGPERPYKTTTIYKFYN